MSDSHFGERGPLPAPPRDFANPPPNYVSDRGYGVVLGIAAVTVILVMCGVFYYLTRPNDLLPLPASTIGIAPNSNTRSGTPTSQPLPAGPRHDQ
jgi:hypothetical protein